MSDLAVDPAVRHRTPTPRKLPATPAAEEALSENATVVEEFRLYYAGAAGSPDFVRVVPEGARVRVSALHDAGLCRIHRGDDLGALVESRHVRLDPGADVRREGYRCKP